jgi:hypothetical protein
MTRSIFQVCFGIGFLITQIALLVNRRLSWQVAWRSSQMKLCLTCARAAMAGMRTLVSPSAIHVIHIMNDAPAVALLTLHIARDTDPTLVPCLSTTLHNAASAICRNPHFLPRCNHCRERLPHLPRYGTLRLTSLFALSTFALFFCISAKSVLPNFTNHKSPCFALKFCELPHP